MAGANIGMGQGYGGGAPMKYTEEFCDDLADVMLEWVQKEDVLRVEDFIVDYGYVYAEIKLFKERSYKFSKVYERVKAIIGKRREHNALTGKYSAPMVMRNQWQYSCEVKEREDEIRHDKHSAEIEAASAIGNKELSQELKQARKSRSRMNPDEE